MNDFEDPMGIAQRRARWCLFVLCGAPLLLALITLTVDYFPVLPSRGEALVRSLNAIMVVVATGLAGAFHDGIEISTMRRVLRAIGFALLGYILHALALMILTMIINHRMFFGS